MITQHEKQTYYKRATCRVFGFITLLSAESPTLKLLRGHPPGNISLLAYCVNFSRTNQANYWGRPTEKGVQSKEFAGQHNLKRTNSVCKPKCLRPSSAASLQIPRISFIIRSWAILVNVRIPNFELQQIFTTNACDRNATSSSHRACRPRNDYGTP